MTIPPYSPQLNPAKKLIGGIKSKIKQAWVNNKSLSLTLLQKIIDSDAWRKWVLSGKIETINKLQAFKNQRSDI